MKRIPLQLLAAVALAIPALAQTPIVAPKGAAPVNNRDLATQLGSFLQNVAAERKLPASSGEPARLFFWKGAAYKPGWAAFARSSYRKALEASGFKYQEIDSVATNIYESQYGVSKNVDEGPRPTLIQLETGDQIEYFSAVQNASGQAVVGVWIDQPEAADCLLAVATVGAQTPTKAPALPTVSAGAVLVKDPRNVMKGVTPLKTPAFRTLARKRGYVRGLALDMNGKPLRGASIAVQSSAAGGFRTSVTAKTNAQGVYEVKVPLGVCQVVNADYSAPYNGGTLRLPLHTLDGQRDYFDSAKGHVENFVLRTWGTADAEAVARWPETGEGYYGASIRVQWFHDGLPENGTLEVTLKPNGPLLDGKRGRTFVARYPVRGDSVLSADHYINNIPIGRYIMTARVFDGSDEMPLRMEKVFSNDAAVEKLNIQFRSSSSSYATLERSGTELYQVILKP